MWCEDKYTPLRNSFLLATEDKKQVSYSVLAWKEIVIEKKWNEQSLVGIINRRGCFRYYTWPSLFFQDPENYMSSYLDGLCSQTEAEAGLIHSPAYSAVGCTNTGVSTQALLREIR